MFLRKAFDCGFFSTQTHNPNLVMIKKYQKNLNIDLQNTG